MGGEIVLTGIVSLRDGFTASATSWGDDLNESRSPWHWPHAMGDCDAIIISVDCYQ